MAFISGINEYNRELVFDASYGNSGFRVPFAPSEEPERDGYVFVRWSMDKTHTDEDHEFKPFNVEHEDVEYIRSMARNLRREQQRRVADNKDISGRNVRGV